MSSRLFTKRGRWRPQSRHHCGRIYRDCDGTRASGTITHNSHRAAISPGKLAARGGKKAKNKAVVAVARKLAVLLHRIWVTQEPYIPFYAEAA
jgi:hypothetical protein